MNTKHQNKIALVTGGASGIGAATARRLAAEGATVIIADRNATGSTIQTDVANPASVASLVEIILANHGRLDLLAHCAGIAAAIPFLETPVETFDHIIAVNLRGTFLVGQAAARAMARSGGGAIVNIASISGMTGNIDRAAYGASKGGVIALSMVMAADLAPHNIRVNTLSPGPVETPLVAGIHNPQARAQWTNRTMLRRYAHPDEIAAAASFLLSDDASYITGQNLPIDGGYLTAGLAAPETKPHGQHR